MNQWLKAGEACLGYIDLAVQTKGTKQLALLPKTNDQRQNTFNQFTLKFIR